MKTLPDIIFFVHSRSDILDELGRAQWNRVLRRISRPTRKHEDDNNSGADSASSEEEIECRFTKSNLSEIRYRNTAAARINRARVKTNFPVIRNMASTSRLDWDNGEGFCEVIYLYIFLYIYIIYI